MLPVVKKWLFLVGSDVKAVSWLTYQECSMKDHIYDELRGDLLLKVIDWGSKVKIVSTLEHHPLKRVVKLSLPVEKVNAAIADARK